MEELINSLNERLKQALPGETAQKKMAPMESDQRRFDRKYRKNARQGAVLVLLYPKEDKVCFPLIQRPHYEGVHSGQIALPGGKHEQSDIDLFQTAVREAEEEIGVEAKKVEVIGSLTEIFIPVSNFVVQPVIGYSFDQIGFIPDDYEVSEVIEVSLSDLLNKNNQGITEIPIGGQLSTQVTISQPKQ